MKKLNLFYFLAIGAMLFFSCKKSETCPAQVKLLTETAPINNIFWVDYNHKIEALGSGSYEYGCVFTVDKPGNITKIGSKMPDSSVYRVTLWDSSTAAVLAEANFTAKAGRLQLETITPVHIIPNTKYIVTVHSKGTKWYQISNPTSAKINFPFRKGSITIIGYNWSSNTGNTAVFPKQPEVTYVAGLADFEFQPD